MAEKLKGWYNLTALKLTLLADEDPPAVLCELEVTRDHRPEIVRAWRLLTADLRLPSNLDEASRVADYRFDLPEQITSELRALLHESFDPRRPLWLHLTKPYGFLGLVPWEEILVPRLSVPILRIPDFNLEPVRSRRMIDVVLCADDASADPDSVAETVGWLARQLPDAIPVRTTVHVFTSMSVHERLRAQTQPAGGSTGSILLYDPAGAPTEADLVAKGTPSASTDTAVAERPNPWLSWMQNEMCGRSADVIHFLAHGTLTMGWGSLVLSVSPVASGPGLVVVPPARLTRFGLKLGAWCCAFSSPQENLSRIGLRLAADTVAQLRPTSLLHHDLRADRDGSALRAAYRFLTSPEPSPPPLHPSVFLYCQPRDVSTEPGNDELPSGSSDVEPFEPSTKVHELLADRLSAPSWVSAAQRFVEQYDWRLRQWNDDQGTASPPPELAGGVTKALNLIQDMVDRFAEPFSAPPKGLHKSEVVDIGGSPRSSGRVTGSTEVP